MAAKNNYYAYRLPDGRHGITDSWAACQNMVIGIRDARYRGFKARAEAEAWLATGAKYIAKPKPKLEPGIYFDAGTGRGEGVEISVTDEQGKDLLHLVMPKSKINKYGKHKVPHEVTNNYGELLAKQDALLLAMKRDVGRIFGDSKLVIDFWSKGAIKRNELPVETVKLAEKVRILRHEFEGQGGVVQRVSGDHNPADLGFH